MDRIDPYKEGAHTMNKKEIWDSRRMYVVKSNDLIQHSRYSLTLQQQKIVLFAVSKIKPHDHINTVYEFSIAELCKVCGFNIDAGGYYYHSIKKDLLRLTQREWGLLPDGSEKTISWIGDVEMRRNDGNIKIRFNPNMEPYLFDLNRCYYRFQLEAGLIFKNEYSLRLYELMRSLTTQKNLDEGMPKVKTLTIEEVKKRMDVSGYDAWYDFERYILRKAVAEINACSEDMNIQYEPRRNGKKMESITFTIAPAYTRQRVAARLKKKELDKYL